MKKRETLEGKIALVTGAARRLGAQVALALAHEGAGVVIHYNRSEDDARRLSDEIKKMGGKSWLVKADFREDGPKGPNYVAQYEGLIDQAIAEAGRLDVLVNNASIFPGDKLGQFTFDDLIENIRVNAWIPFYLGREFAKRTGQGKIVNFLDTRIRDHSPKWHAAYKLSKNLLEIMTKMSALEFAPGVTVNAVAPGLILPPEGKGQEYMEKLKSTMPLNKIGDPQDVADAVIFLLKSSFITGQVIYVDGGRHLKGTENG
jgi:pteridine reductase